MLPESRTVSFRSMLYLGTLLATVILLTHGDFTSIPEELQDETGGIFWVWGGLSLWAPPTALLADWLIRKSPPCKYRAMWIRLGADLSQLVAMVIYLVMRLYLGDYHIYTMGLLFAVIVYVFHLVLWDSEQLIGVEKLASRLQKES